MADGYAVGAISQGTDKADPPTFMGIVNVVGSALQGSFHILEELERHAQNLTGSVPPTPVDPPTNGPKPAGALPDLHATARQLQNVIGRIGLVTAHLLRAHG